MATSSDAKLVTSNAAPNSYLPVQNRYNQLPISFELNAGQHNKQVRFSAHAKGLALALTSDGAIFSLREASKKSMSRIEHDSLTKSERVRMKLLDARVAKVEGIDTLPGVANYFIGNDRRKWRVNVPTYKGVKYQNIYDGIDLVFHGNQHQLEYDFIVSPGASPDRIAMTFAGAVSLIETNGDLVLKTRSLTLRHSKPFAYQLINGQKQEVKANYQIRGKSIGFEVGAYDKDSPLIIDPVLLYSTLLGGSDLDQGWGIAVDNAGSAYIVGITDSTDLPVPGAIDATGNGLEDAFVAKLAPGGNALVYSTYLGGSEVEWGNAIAVDAQGSAYVVGRTDSADFPVTVGALQTTRDTAADAFLAKLSPSGSSLVYSSYLGGNYSDIAYGVAVDPAGNAFVVGQTDSTQTTLLPSLNFSRHGNAVSKSVDAAAHWTPGSDGLTASFASCFAQDPVNAQTIFAGTFRGVFRSTDSGAHWQQFRPDLFVNAIAIDPSNPNTIYLGTSQGVYKSTDGGSNYVRKSSPFGTSFVVSLAVDPTTSAIFAGALQGVFKSTNGADSWTPSSTGISPLVRINRIIFDPTNTSTMYLGTGGGGNVYKSTNSGAVWTQINNEIPNSIGTVTDLAINPQSPSTVYVSLAPGGFNSTCIYKTTNGGASWSASDTGLGLNTFDGPTKPVPNALAIDPSTPNTLYAGTSGGGVFKSTDGGTTWSASNTGLPNVNVNAILVDRSNPVSILAGVNVGLDAFIAEVDPTGSSLLYSAMIGGDENDSAFGVAVDSDGAPYVAGVTSSRNFPLINAVDPNFSGTSEAFVMKFNVPIGISYSTFLGGGRTEVANAIAVRNGSAYVVGSTFSSDFPLAKPFDATLSSFSSGAFVTKLSPSGNTLEFSTYLGGEDGTNEAFGVAVNAGGVYVTGDTSSGSFPTLKAPQVTRGGGLDAFVTKFTPTGSALIYSTYLGGSGDDIGNGIGLDPAGNAYVTGLELSPNFPVTPGAFQIANHGFVDAFVAKIDNSLTISGVVTNGSTPQAGVKITLTGTSVGSITTASDGIYEFSNLAPGGTYTVSATKSGFTATPSSQTFSNLNANQIANFTIASSATPFHTISGQIVVLDSLVPLAGANVALTGSQTEFTDTDASGNYSFSVPEGGNYTITPTKPGFNFFPISNSAINFSQDITFNFQSLKVGFFVTNTNNQGPGSFRQALSDANASPGEDRVSFNIPGTGIKTIAITTPLPAITDPITIDGTTQSGFAGLPLIELNGNSETTGVPGLVITSGSSTIRALAINRFFGPAILLQTNGNNKIEGNILGLDATGTIAQANRLGGIVINSGSTTNIIGGTTANKRNIISGNLGNGISLDTSDNVIKGNFIGTNVTGTAALGNSQNGIETITTGPPPSVDIQIGGTEPGAGNLISSNALFGLRITQPAIIQGNLIGTDVTGTHVLGVQSTGLVVTAQKCTIGGTTPSARNIISGNTVGVSMNTGTNTGVITLKGNYVGTDVTGTVKLGNGDGVFAGRGSVIGGLEAGAGNVISGNDNSGLVVSFDGTFVNVQGNLIGTDATGQQAIGNDFGVLVEGVVTTIGGSQAGARNVISGNRVGIVVIPDPIDTTIQGNFIGVSVDGMKPLGNRDGGIFLLVAKRTRIGGEAPGEANTIAFNGYGIALFGTFEAFANRFNGNRIFSNETLGIDLDGDELVTPNDPGDVDEGPNTLLNFPIISSITTDGVSTNIKGSLNSGPSFQYRIDFYSNAACDPSGNGEGALPFGSTQVTTDLDGNATFDVTIPTPLGMNRTITATSTVGNLATSEFSPCASANTRGSLEFTTRDLTVLEDLGTAEVRVVRTGGSKGSLSINYATADGTATAGSDYTPVSGTLNFADGETEKIISLPVTNDVVVEPEERLVLTLSGAPDLEAFGAKYEVEVHLLDPTTPLQLAVDNQSLFGYQEGNFGSRTVNIPAHLNAQTTRTVNVSYSVTAGSATANVDFIPTSGTLTFNPKTDTQNIPVQFIGDKLDEDDETILLTLSNPLNASLPTPTVEIPIIDEDPRPTLTVADVSVVEGAGAKAIFSVSLNEPSGKSVQVSFHTLDQTAHHFSDYTDTSGTLVFAPGETVKLVEVPILTDGTIEPNETFVLFIDSSVNAGILDPAGVGTIFDSSSSTSVFNFGASSYTANESDGQVQITVTRSGGTTVDASVDYQTVIGSANERTDYTPIVGTLHFEPGVTSLSFNVLLTDDTFAEPTESVNLMLLNPIGAVLGGPTTVPLNIISTDITDTGSPVRIASFNTAFFVRQHYHDFLNRAPDAAGLAFWMNEIDSCGANQQCLEIKKINVSAAFFQSIEFQETGYLVYRAYRAAYGQTNVVVPVPIIRFNEFLPESQRIGRDVQVGIGNWEQQLENNKVAYFQEFVQRQRFLTAYPLSLTPAQFVDQLNQNSGRVLSQNERDQLVTELTGAPTLRQGRASVLRKVADDSDMKNNEKNRAFVLMQYYGYLRRNPDDPQDMDFTGWEFWLSKLNQFNGNFIDAEMVKAFLSSIEYGDRFGK